MNLIEIKVKEEREISNPIDGVNLARREASKYGKKLFDINVKNQTIC